MNLDIPELFYIQDIFWLLVLYIYINKCSYVYIYEMTPMLMLCIFCLLFSPCHYSSSSLLLFSQSFLISLYSFFSMIFFSFSSFPVTDCVIHFYPEGSQSHPSQQYFSKRIISVSLQISQLIESGHLRQESYTVCCFQLFRVCYGPEVWIQLLTFGRFIESK